MVNHKYESAPYELRRLEVQTGALVALEQPDSPTGIKWPWITV